VTPPDARVNTCATRRSGLKRDNGDALRKDILSVGNTPETMDSYRADAGRDPEAEAEALLRRRGLH